ncbi:MAG: hypothetical protein Q4D79_05695 [Propionibacteriaceae bacterium]|nr:hypothetical protein [Propionibacteriaceae bacterium]
MRTTLDINEQALKLAQARAKREGISLGQNFKPHQHRGFVDAAGVIAALMIPMAVGDIPSI